VGAQVHPGTMDGTLIQGVGQGNGSGPQIWGSNEFPVI